MGNAYHAMNATVWFIFETPRPPLTLDGEAAPPNPYGASKRAKNPRKIDRSGYSSAGGNPAPDPKQRPGMDPWWGCRPQRRGAALPLGLALADTTPSGAGQPAGTGARDQPAGTGAGHPRGGRPAGAGTAGPAGQRAPADAAGEGRAGVDAQERGAVVVGKDIWKTMCANLIGSNDFCGSTKLKSRKIGSNLGRQTPNYFRIIASCSSRCFLRKAPRCFLSI